MKTLLRSIKEITRYPSAIGGLVIVGLLVALALYALVSMPYEKAIQLWRGGEEIWGENPKTAPPAWLNYFSKVKQPPTMILNTQDGTASKSQEAISEGMTDITMVFPVDYPYDGFPQEVSIYFTANYQEKPPYVSLTWLTPDGREIRVGDFSVDKTKTYRLSQDERLIRRLKGLPAEQGLFAAPGSEPVTALPGTYQMRIVATVFEPDATVDAKMIFYGQLHGLAGTDHRRRDLSVALLWGTPVALAFGLLAALGTTFTTMFIAAIGVWFGGWVDDLIQRITEIDAVLPFLPILIMIGTFYSRSIWLMLGAAIVLTIFGARIKGYRAIFLQVKESPYIEAAQAYGANNWRVIFSYLIPRVVPVVIPALVNAIPAFVFLEAGLAFLGLGDPVLPTWGKIVNDAYNNGALFAGLYYWVLEPSVLLMVTGLAFAMIGFALDRIFNPRLRGV